MPAPTATTAATTIAIKVLRTVRVWPPLSDTVSQRTASSDHREQLAEIADPRAAPVLALGPELLVGVDRRIPDLDGRHADRLGAGELPVRTIAAEQARGRLDTETF